MSIEKEKLTTQQLDNVSGGAGNTDNYYEGFTGFISMYALDDYKTGGSKANTPLYFVTGVRDDDTYETGWLYGYLQDTYEKDIGCDNSIRKHVVKVIDSSSNLSYRRGDTYTMTGDEWCAYTTKTN